jgi:hypothetical protein
MPTVVKCPSCGQRYQLPTNLAGQSVRCRQCRIVFKIDDPDEPPEVQPIEDLTADPIPGQRRSRRLDPEDEPRPRQRRPEKKSGRVILIVGLVLGLLGTVAGGLALTFWLRGPGVPDRADAAGPQAAGPEQPEPQPDIVPPKLEKETVSLALPGPARTVTVGGGGRYLIAHLPNQRQLAIFDANAAKVVKYLSIGEDKILLAAGQRHLFVVRPEKRTVQRWNLATFEAQPAVPLPVDSVHAIGIGFASNGPLILGVPEQPFGDLRLQFFDAETLKPLEVKCDQQRRPSSVVDRPAQIRVSASGTTLGMWSVNVSPSGVYVGTIVGDRLNLRHEHDSDGALLPSPDGQTVYGSRRIYSSDLAVLGDWKQLDGGSALPALSGPWFIRTTGGDRFPPRADNQPRIRTLHAGRSQIPMATLPTLPELDDKFDPFDRRPDRLLQDMRLFLIPRAKLLVTLPDTADAFVVRSYDPEEALRKSNQDYLLELSAPPGRFTPGTTFVYSLQTRSSKAGLKYSVEAGPKGMSVSAEGRVTWAVPANFADPEVDVILKITDAGQQELLHTFRLRLREDGPLVRNDPPVVRPDPMPDPVKPPVAAGPTALLPLVPPDLKGAKTVPLPSTAADCVVGGEGRFLIFQLPQSRQAAILDVNEARIVKYLPLLEDKALLAAGMTRLVIVYPEKRQIQRWNLTTFEKETTLAVPVLGNVRQALMGCASEGPLVLTAGEDDFRAKQHFIDLITLKPLPEPKWQGNSRGFGGANTRISPDGTILAMWGEGSPSGVETANRITGMRYYDHNSAGFLLPGPDGQTLFTAGGLRNIQCKSLEPDRPFEPGGRGTGATLPATHGRGYLRLSSLNKWPGDANPNLSVQMLGLDKPLATLNLPEGLDLAEGFGRQGGLSMDRRLTWVPGAKVLAILPVAADKVILHRFDLEDFLVKSGQDYLAVFSRPEPRVALGQTYSYTLDAKSNKGGLKYAVTAGPPGMTVSAAGKVSWAVPANFAEPSVDVILTVSDASGKETFHSFRISVGK